MSGYAPLTKTVNVCGYEFVIRKDCLDVQMQVAALLVDLEKDWEGIEVGDNTELQLRRYMQCVVYPIVYACTTCETNSLPTYKEFISMETEESERWVNAVKQHNPNILPDEMSVGQEPLPPTPEEVKKKETKTTA